VERHRAAKTVAGFCTLKALHFLRKGLHNNRHDEPAIFREQSESAANTGLKFGSAARLETGILAAALVLR
jgi:hypothetical protein